MGLPDNKKTLKGVIMDGYNGMMELIDAFGESYILESLMNALSDDELFDAYCYICKNEDFSGHYLDDCDM
jgi:hypothetical protein